MRPEVDYEATIKSFFKEALSWLEGRPVRLRDGQNKEKITYEYMKNVQSDPCQHTMNHAVYSHFNELNGFLEYYIDRSGNVKSNNELFFAVVDVLDAIGDFYEENSLYNSGKLDSLHYRNELIKKIKKFQVALNRKNFLKSTFYKMKTPYYFAQKQK